MGILQIPLVIHFRISPHTHRRQHQHRQQSPGERAAMGQSRLLQKSSHGTRPIRRAPPPRSSGTWRVGLGCSGGGGGQDPLSGEGIPWRAVLRTSAFPRGTAIATAGYRSTSSTRRFFARPSSVPLLPAGAAMPAPNDVSRSFAMPYSPASAATIDAARRRDRSTL